MQTRTNKRPIAMCLGKNCIDIYIYIYIYIYIFARQSYRRKRPPSHVYYIIKTTERASIYSRPLLKPDRIRNLERKFPVQLQHTAHI